MAYTAEISRNNPSCFLFLIDQSDSMSENISGQNKPKSEAVSDAVNRLLSNLAIKCAKSEGIRDYYHVGAIGYGIDVDSAFSSQSNKVLAPISYYADNPLRIETRNKKVDDGAGGLIEQKIKFPVWLDPVADGETPMTEAFSKANQVIEEWIKVYPDSFPPTIIHITDGESSDGNPKEEMLRLTNQATNDGNVLLFNLHVSSNPNAVKIEFPNSAAHLPDEYAKLLYESASQLTPFMVTIAEQEYSLEVSDTSKGFVLNGDLALIITALDIGTRPSNLR